MHKDMCEGRDESKACRNPCYKAMRINLSYHLCNKVIDSPSKNITIEEEKSIDFCIPPVGAGTREAACPPGLVSGPGGSLAHTRTRYAI